MGLKVVWFNTWFSAIALTIKAMKETFDNVHIIGTNRSSDCAYKGVVDEFYVEEQMNSGEYLEWALEFCKKHSINVFFPKYHIEVVSQHVDRFKCIGVTVISEEYTTISKFDSKEEIYRELSKVGYEHIPKYSTVTSLKEFKDAYELYRSLGEIVCCKYDKDEGASSFRVIDDGFLCIESLGSTLENILSYSNMVKILDDAENKAKFKKMMVMPKLFGPEVSADCYRSKNEGLIVIPRYKLGGRVKEIKLNSDIISDCMRLQKIFNFKYGFNVQYRWSKSKEMKMLEINPRLSGGVHISSLCGYNIPNQILADIICENLNQSVHTIREVRVTQLETPVIL